jgi:hypothetical protein
MTPTEATKEEAMFIPPSKIGWKCRLYNDKKEYTHYLIHPDGGKPGSMGCIVLPDMAANLQTILEKLMSVYSEIKVCVAMEK